MKNISKVPQNDNKFGEDDLVKARYTALHLEGFVMRKWIKQINDPSNSMPNSDARVIGENNDQNIISDVFATMKREIPEPRPYPPFIIESNKITINPANISCIMISMIFTNPRASGGP